MRPIHVAPVLALTALGLGSPSRQAVPDEEVKAVADAFVAELVRVYPEQAGFRGLAGAASDRLSDNSIAAVRGWEAREDGWARRLRAALPALDRDSPWRPVAQILDFYFETAAASRVCRMELWSVSHIRGWQVLFPVIARGTAVRDSADRAAYLARWSRLPRYVDAEIANLRAGIAAGYTAPRAVVDRVAGQVAGLADLEPQASPFFAPAAADAGGAFPDSLRGLLEREIQPALARFRGFLAAEYAPAARTTLAVSALPDGRTCYTALVHSETSVALSPDSIHRLGLAEVDRITREMVAIAEREFGTRDVQRAFDSAGGRAEYRFRSRDDMVAYAERLLAKTRAVLPTWFGRLPNADVTVEPYPPYQEASAPGGQYFPPPPDGSRPGIYRLNTANAAQKNAIGLEALTFHEGIPGHHLQSALLAEQGDLHPVAQVLGSTAFLEGWGLYAERLADEAGLYSSPGTRLGMLGSERFRAARLVVDTGIHWYGWSREEAIAYMQRAIGAGPGIAVEIDRYAVQPGQALAYQLGSLEIQRLRAEAQVRLGPRFSVAAFHDLVLSAGIPTLPMLADRVERWVARGGR
jgi:uncharacterized protein (DUF885 family)